MTFAIVDAKKATNQIPVSVALSGGAGSGKTWSALMIATELADGGNIGFLDTENGRGLEYREFFDYRYLMLDAPFSPDRYEAAIQALIDDGCKALVVDSGSHAWEQEGGILESVDAFCQEKAKANRSSPDKYNAQAWARFRPIHRHMIHFASRNAVPTVWCFRAREKTKVERVNGKIEFVPQGWQPITSDLASFEVSMFAMLEPPLETGCKPGTVLRCKVTKPLEGVIEPGKRIDKKAARAIADYAKLKSVADTPPATPERSEGAAVAQQMGIQHEQGGLIEDDDPGFGGFEFNESDLKRARQLRAKIAKVHSSDGVSDLDGMVMDMKGLIPDEQFKVLNEELQAASFAVLKKEKAA